MKGFLARHKTNSPRVINNLNSGFNQPKGSMNVLWGNVEVRKKFLQWLVSKGFILEKSDDNTQYGICKDVLVVNPERTLVFTIIKDFIEPTQTYGRSIYEVIESSWYLYLDDFCRKYPSSLVTVYKYKPSKEELNKDSLKEKTRLANYYQDEKGNTFITVKRFVMTDLDTVKVRCEVNNKRCASTPILYVSEAFLLRYKPKDKADIYQ